MRRINQFQEKEAESSVVKGDNSKMSGKTSNMTVPTHLQSLFEASSECLTDREAAALADMLKKYDSTFSKDEHDLGLTDVVCHSIDTGDSKPIKQPPRRVPIALAGEELKAIKMLEKQKFIRSHHGVLPFCSSKRKMAKSDLVCTTEN